ncbi:MAG: helix-turn-helix transcriptional regulator [Desulfobulbaceae bacterium]|nr:helix-turn-helix transcriptional regulator [Desulfobulbaceae bacterium]HIJ79076.1 helix-turn-helix transcriptional regulator [Deltaproteobacteria bacterium]
MKCIDYDKAELLQELTTLKVHIHHLETQNKKLAEQCACKENIEIALRERVKELNCLYEISKLIDIHKKSLDDFLLGVVNLLPVSWQYPDITCARILFKDNEYATPNFSNSKWKQMAPIKTDGKNIGRIEVYYLKNKPVIDEGPFLNEERLLINAIAKKIGITSERFSLDQQLKTEKNSLKKTNIALHEVLEKIQHEKKIMGLAIQDNVDKTIMPILDILEKGLSPDQKKVLSILRKNWEDIITPASGIENKKLKSLTPTELVICNMIKNGLNSKEIAQMRGICPDTVSRHREHIRKKLGLANNKINLTTYLNSTQ